MKIVKIESSLGGLGKSDGSEKAPDQIIQALQELGINCHGRLPNLEVVSADVVPNNANLTGKAIFDAAKNTLGQNPVFIGGDHSLTYYTVKALSQQIENMGIVVFDAHPDLMQSFEPPTHENYLRMLIEEGIIQPENVILVSIRNIDPEEQNFIAKNKIKFYDVKRLCLNSMQDCCDSIMEYAKDFGGLYISLDIDAADCAFAPGTGYPEACGLTSSQLLYFMLRLKLLKNIVAYDVVEVNPPKDINNMTSKLAARIILELF